MTGRWISGIALLAAGAAMAWHAYGFGVAATHRLSTVPSRLERFLAKAPTVPRNAAALAYRTLPEFARQLPRDARTLVLSPFLEPVQFEFYLTPRPLRVLYSFQLSPEQRKELEAAEPAARYVVEARERELQERGMVWTDASLAAAAAWADAVIGFGLGARALGPHAADFELAGAREGVVLLRRR
ncbi:MAG: hypothetical protein AAF628_23155 [Planctomycetota bacterium]